MAIFLAVWVLAVLALGFTGLVLWLKSSRSELPLWRNALGVFSVISVVANWAWFLFLAYRGQIGGFGTLPQVAQRPLARTARRSHRLYQRPVGVILTVLAALMRPQKHLPRSLSSAGFGCKRVGLHYIAFSKPAIAKTRLVSIPTSKPAEFSTFATNFG